MLLYAFSTICASSEAWLFEFLSVTAAGLFLTALPWIFIGVVIFVGLALLRAIMPLVEVLFGILSVAFQIGALIGLGYLVIKWVA